MSQPLIYLTSLHLKAGGCERSITSLANALVARGYDVTILCTYNFGTPAYHIDPRVRIEYLTDRLPNREAFKQAVNERKPLKIITEGVSGILTLKEKSSALAKRLKRIEEGVIISSRDHDSVILSKVKRAEVTAISHVHYDPSMDEQLLENLGSSYDNIDHIVVLVPEFIKVIQRNLPLSSSTQVSAIPNFLETSYLEESLDLSNAIRKKTVIAVGRLEKEKGFEKLLDIWGSLFKSFPDWGLEIVGDGSLKPALESIVESSGAGEVVTFTGTLTTEQLSLRYREASIFALPSLTEGFGIVLLEAGAHYLPLITFDIPGGPKQLIDPAINGYRASNEEAFSRYLSALMSDPTERTRMGHNARRTSEAYSEEHTILLWVSLLDAPHSPCGVCRNTRG